MRLATFSPFGPRSVSAWALAAPSAHGHRMVAKTTVIHSQTTIVH